MHQLLQNKLVRFGGGGLVIIIALFIFWVVINLLSSSSGLESRSSNTMYAPSVGVTNPSAGKSLSYDREMGMAEEMDSAYYPTPQIAPAPDGYTSDLEQYETSNYSVSARTKQFDELCDTVTALKADTQIHFKSLSRSTNNCSATFYADEVMVNSILNKLNTYKGVEVTRLTQSVTRHRQNIQSQTSIIQQQLNSVQRSLTAAETQFDEIADIARQSNDAASLSEAIRYKLQNIDNLTQRKINLTSQLDRLYQQAADLEERIDVVQFDISVYRSNPIYPNQTSQKWERAWDELNDAFTDTQIGLTAFFGIFLLWVIRISVYLLVIIVFLWGLWKIAKRLWKKPAQDTNQQ